MNATTVGGSFRFETSSMESLRDLALDLRWAFDHSADELWSRLDADLWELTHNPWIILRTISRERLSSIAAEKDFCDLLARLNEERRDEERAEAWFQRAHPGVALKTIAYFSMEFMLSEALPIYSGGLGNVAGDQLKAASNLGVPVIGVGLLYQQGYFRQAIDAHGRQKALYPFNDPGQLPIRPLRDRNGEWLRLQIAFPGSSLWVRAWQARIGRTRLLLLDTNDAANLPAHRAITSELYGGDADMRVQQEIILGIGGWRLLRQLGLQPEVCHLNEGHAAFAVLERARSYMEENGQPFEVALMATRAGNIFTTHTPVEAGFDYFAPDLMEKYFNTYAERQLAISFHDLLALGRRDSNDPREPFNMAYLAVRGSAYINGVSRIHGEVSRILLQGLFPRWPEKEVPVSHVTNGIHTPTWDSAEADRLWEQSCGTGCWDGTMSGMEEKFRKVSDASLWELRGKARRSLVDYVRNRYARQLAGRGESPAEIEKARNVLDPDALTLGFARRFATYKRPTLLLHDPERLLRLLTNPERPVQLFLAGKAHPKDLQGQEMLREWIQFVQRPEVFSRVVFLSDYDVLMAEQLVQGVDVWVNTPRRPWEASGTSGMKVLVNGGLNLSELDGWWAEAYSPEVGWAIGNGRVGASDSETDAADAEVLYATLEQEIAREFYERDSEGIPRRWVHRMRESMARLTPLFSTNRVVRQYTEEYYLEAAAGYVGRAADESRKARELLNWQKGLAKHARELRFGWARVEQGSQNYRFQAQVFFGSADPDWLRIELYAEGNPGAPPERWPMRRGERIEAAENGYVFRADVPAARAVTDYTPRIVAHYGESKDGGARVPLEAPLIVWHDSPGWRRG